MHPKHQTPLQYLLSVLNDPTHTVDQRIRAARIALPFTHAKVRASTPGAGRQRSSMVTAPRNHGRNNQSLALVKKP